MRQRPARSGTLLDEAIRPANFAVARYVFRLRRSGCTNIVLAWLLSVPWIDGFFAISGFGTAWVIVAIRTGRLRLIAGRTWLVRRVAITGYTALGTVVGVIIVIAPIRS